jgi:hypothetical protein
MVEGGRQVSQGGFLLNNKNRMLPMNASTAGSDAGAMPSAAWVRFLRSYGPTPNDSNLFDEYVTGVSALIEY